MYNIKNNGLISEIKTQVDKYDIISFDIFDTLLLRAYANPDDLFLHLQTINDDEDFPTKRGYAYRTACVRNPQREEMTLDLIYDVLGKRYQSMKQQELDMEESVLTTNPEMLEVFNYAKSKGKKIIIVSDMYLPGTFLEKVLQKNGFEGYHKLYVSSDFNKTKRSGNLYKHVLNELNISPNQMLHIGDNHAVDCQVANAFGIASFYYEKIMIRFLNKNPKANAFYQKNNGNLAASIILGVSAIKSLSCGDDYWTNLGYDYAGPAIYSYVEWLYKNFKNDEINDVLFVARDGYTLQKVFDLYNDDSIQSHYFYAPRTLYMSILLAPVSFFQSEKDRLAGTNRILNYYKDKHPYLHENTPDIVNSNEGLSFIKANYDLYQELASQEVLEYLTYIQSKNIRGGNIALVDAQSCSLSAQKLATTFLTNCDVHGYYWRYLKQSSYEAPELYCKAFEPGFDIYRNWAFVEFIITAPEPYACGVLNKKPLYANECSKIENERIAKYQFVSEGALEFAKDIHKYYHGENVFIDYSIIYDLISVLTDSPSKDDLANLPVVKQEFAEGGYCDFFPNWSNLKVEA